MDHDEATLAARAVAALAGRLAKDTHLAAEMQRARREFFLDGPAGSASLPGAADAAELRFQEWFTLERESEVLGAVPATVAEIAGEAVDYADSQAGLWLVQNCTPRTVEARDLQDGQTIDLNAPAGALQPGDLVVGRVFAEGAGRWTPSTAAAIFRPGNELAQAFLRDMQRVGLERRLQQVELERLLLLRPNAPRAVGSAPAAPPAAPEEPLEHLEADLDRLLTVAGSEHSATAISQQLAMAVRPGQVLGPLLDELAFDTTIDLDAARELLLAIWNAHHGARVADGEAPAEERAAPGESLGERLVRTLDEGLAQKRDVEELFAQLERMAGIEPDEAGDDEDDLEGDDDADDAADEDDFDTANDEDEAGDGDDDGNLAALIEEYLWETGRSDDPAAADLRHFARLQANAALPHRDLEEITSADCMRLLLHVYLAAPPTERAARVRSTFEQLRGFYQWAVEVQEMDVGSVLDGCRGALIDQIDRLQAACLALSTPAPGRVRPGMLEVEEVAAKGFGVRDDDGGDHWIDAPAACQHLRIGDLLLGALQPVGGGPRAGRSFTGMVVALPSDARALME